MVEEFHNTVLTRGKPDTLTGDCRGKAIKATVDTSKAKWLVDNRSLPLKFTHSVNQNNKTNYANSILYEAIPTDKKLFSVKFIGIKEEKAYCFVTEIAGKQAGFHLFFTKKHSYHETLLAAQAQDLPLEISVGLKDDGDYYLFGVNFDHCICGDFMPSSYDGGELRGTLLTYTSAEHQEDLLTLDKKQVEDLYKQSTLYALHRLDIYPVKLDWVEKVSDYQLKFDDFSSYGEEESIKGLFHSIEQLAISLGKYSIDVLCVEIANLYLFIELSELIKQGVLSINPGTRFYMSLIKKEKKTVVG